MGLGAPRKGQERAPIKANQNGAQNAPRLKTLVSSGLHTRDSTPEACQDIANIILLTLSFT